MNDKEKKLADTILDKAQEANLPMGEIASAIRAYSELISASAFREKADRDAKATITGK